MKGMGDSLAAGVSLSLGSPRAEAPFHRRETARLKPRPSRFLGVASLQPSVTSSGLLPPAPSRLTLIFRSPETIASASCSSETG